MCSLLTFLQSIDGRSVRVDFSLTERPHDSTPGKYMGKSSHNDRGFRGGRSRGPRSYDRYDGERRDRDYHQQPEGGHRDRSHSPRRGREVEYQRDDPNKDEFGRDV